MDFNAAKINNTQAASQVTAHKVLSEGSVVPVRVTRALGGGRYGGFVAGVKISFSAERPLKAGDFFTATVSGGEGSKIILTPKSDTALSVLQNPAVLLQNAGLSSDTLSSSIFQMFTQTGLKIDAQLMNRIKSLALRFSGKEKSAAELLVMLAEKGISADEEEIKQLLMQLAGELSCQEDAPENQNNQNQKHQKKLINRINSTDGAWYLVPFEMIDNKSVLGTGNIRLLFDSGKMLKLLNLDCIYRSKRYLFSLGYEAGKCKTVRFNTDNPDSALNDLKKRFLAADMPGLEISYADFSEIDGNASGLEEIYTFGGVV